MLEISMIYWYYDTHATSDTRSTSPKQSTGTFLSSRGQLSSSILTRNYNDYNELKKMTREKRQESQEILSKVRYLD